VRRGRGWHYFDPALHRAERVENLAVLWLTIFASSSGAAQCARGTWRGCGPPQRCRATRKRRLRRGRSVDIVGVREQDVANELTGGRVGDSPNRVVSGAVGWPLIEWDGRPSSSRMQIDEQEWP
jgi:hypothetical protein